MSNSSPQRSPRYSGGCQCGAVRFALYSDPLKIGICHCRMCQKAVAGPFAVLAEVPQHQFAWTRGTPATFQSSTRALRDFCAACGTPLSYRHSGGPIIELLTGAFDQPDLVPPSYAVGTEFDARLARRGCRAAWQDDLGQPWPGAARRGQLPAPRPRHRARLAARADEPARSVG